MSNVQSRNRWVPGLLGCILAFSGASATAQQSLDLRFLEGLRQRQLFELATQYCADRLSRIAKDDAAQADLTVELVRTLATHAASLPAGEREPWWTRARVAAREFVSRSPEHPRLMLVRLQDALTPLAEGELSRQEHEAGALGP